MRTAICVHPDFDATWPWAADHAHRRLAAQEPVAFHRVAVADRRPAADMIDDPNAVQRLVWMLGLVPGDQSVNRSGVEVVLTEKFLRLALFPFGEIGNFFKGARLHWFDVKFSH